MTYHSEIVICVFCKGEGFQSRHEVTDYHRDVVKWICGHCDGAGRRRKITRVRKIKVALGALKITLRFFEQSSAFEISEVVCRGVDTLGELWAAEHNVRKFPANWGALGELRECTEMAEYGDLFCGPLDMIDKLR